VVVGGGGVVVGGSSRSLSVCTPKRVCQCSRQFALPLWSCRHRDWSAYRAEGVLRRRKHFHAPCTPHCPSSTRMAPCPALVCRLTTRQGGGGVGLTSLHLRWPCDATSGAIKPLPHPIHPPPTLLSIVSFTAVSPPTLQRCWPRGRSTAWHCKVRLRRATCVVGRSYRHAVLPPRRTGAQAQQDGPCGCCICAAGRIPQGGSG
jgi:hypothetical protein